MEMGPEKAASGYQNRQRIPSEPGRLGTIREERIYYPLKSEEGKHVLKVPNSVKIQL